MNKLSQHLLEELSDIEEVIEQKAYDAFLTGISNAMQDLGFGGLDPEKIAPKAEPKQKKEPAASPKEKTNGTMKVRSRGRKGREPSSKGADLPELTDTQKKMMETIQNHIDEQGESPTYTELSKELNKSGVATIVHALQNKGWINLNDKKYSRKIELVHRV